ncbi:MAG: hypothetical protein JRJ23_01320 [Deltaproteobacteria bacterium]|nr:hypothetical protein [Deltaproteobacteria bacterium]MBW1913300.1 hypothetical protein [Deltaproteobacteria bacterium]
MAEPTSDKHYETNFEFPMWKLIKQRAEEKDISYLAASAEIIPEYAKTIRYRDTEFEAQAITKRAEELNALFQKEGMGASNIKELLDEYTEELKRTRYAQEVDK